MLTEARYRRNDVTLVEGGRGGYELRSRSDLLPFDVLYQAKVIYARHLWAAEILHSMHVITFVDILPKSHLACAPREAKGVLHREGMAAYDYSTVMRLLRYPHDARVRHAMFEPHADWEVRQMFVQGEDYRASFDALDELLYDLKEGRIDVQKKLAPDPQLCHDA